MQKGRQAVVVQFHRVQIVVISGINRKSALQVKPCPNYYFSLACLWQSSVFLIDYIAGLAHILPINRKTNLWKSIHYLSTHFHKC